MEVLRRSSVFAAEIMDAFDRSPTDKELVAQAKALGREFVHARLLRAGLSWSAPERAAPVPGGRLAEVCAVLLRLVGDRGDRRLPGCGDPDLLCRHHVGQGCVSVLGGRGAGRGLCAAGPARPGARPRRLSRGVCAEDAGNLAAEAWWMDRRAQVCGQHRPRPALSLAGGRALQLWPFPEGCLLHAVAGEMRCWLRQEPRGPSAPPQLGRPSEPPLSGRWRPCPEPLLQSPGPLHRGLRVSPRPGAGLQCRPFGLAAPGSPARPVLPGPEGCTSSRP